VLDPLTCLTIITGAVKAIDTVAKTTKNLTAIHGNLVKLSEAYCDLREHGRQDKKRKGIYKKIKQKSAGQEALDHMMIEKKLKQIDSDLKKRMVWGDLHAVCGLDFYNKYIALRNKIQKQREQEEYLRLRKREELIHKSKMLTAIAVMLFILGYLIHFLWISIQEASK